MLSLFPQLLDWSWYVPLVFRGFLALYLFVIAAHFIKNDKKQNAEQLANALLGAILLILGLAFLFGIAVQIAGVIGFSLALIAMFLKNRHAKEMEESLWFYALIGLVAFSLIFLGAGPYAFDLPL